MLQTLRFGSTCGVMMGRILKISFLDTLLLSLSSIVRLMIEVMLLTIHRLDRGLGVSCLRVRLLTN